MLRSIQYLRAFAALVVIVRHSEWVPGRWGDQGVDIFFVISGFIMMHVSPREAEPLRFLRARIERVVPLYWLVTLYAGMREHPIDWRHILLSMAFIPHADPDGLIFPVVRQGWSLLYEVFFYALFAASLLLPRRMMLPALTAILGSLAILGWTTNALEGSMPAQVYLSPLHLEFLAGAWLHWAWERRAFLFRPAYGFAAIAASCLFLVLIQNHDPGQLRALVWGAPCLLLVAGMLALENALPRWGWLLLLGNASYSIYLTHAFVLRFFMNIFRPSPSWTGINHVVVSCAAITAVLAGCAIVGIVVHLIVERPMADILKRHRKPKALAAT